MSPCGYQEILSTFIEVELQKDFNLVAETLTRIGAPDKESKKLYQACHLFQKRGKYYVVSYKEMRWLDGEDNEMSDDDTLRRNAVAFLLERWGLAKIISDRDVINDRSEKVFVLPYEEKGDWRLMANYTFGQKKKAKD